MPASRKTRRGASSETTGAAREIRPAVCFGPSVCNNLEEAEKREWLVANGIGGFASGSVAGSSTRRYHGLLVAALDPPGGRTVLVAGLDELFSAGGAATRLATHRWGSGAVYPRGYLHIESFRLEGALPVWTY